MLSSQRIGTRASGMLRGATQIRRNLPPFFRANGAAAGDFAALHSKVFGEFAAQTSGVKCGECGHLRRFQPGVEQSDESGEVCGVEDDDHVLHVGAVLFDVLTQVLCDFAVSGEQVFACHACLAGRTAGGDDVFCIFESLSHVSGGGEVHTVIAAVEHFFHHAFHARSIDVIEAHIRGELHGESGLYHRGTDGAAGTYDNQFVFCKKSHF